jgi:hypothetical protein
LTAKEHDMRLAIRRSTLCALVLTCAVQLGAEPRLAAAQSPESSSSAPKFPGDESYLRWLSPGNEAYMTLDGDRMKQLVVEQTAIARRYRDAGHQYWGRIIGTDADHETATWMAEQLRHAGAEVRLEELDLPPQWVPRSWEASASRPGEGVTLASAMPTYASAGTSSDGIDVELIDVGLGMETDFRGRHVRGKAVVIHAIPRPGIISLMRSAAVRGAIERSGDNGAAAILIVIELPGNIQTLIYRVNSTVPTLTLGSDDGATLQRMLAEADAGQPPRLRLRLDVQEVAGLTTSVVSGVVPAATEDAERVVIVAHRDAFFEGASDNASGVATAIELARYFAQVPRDQRRRAVEIIGTPGHHNRAGTGPAWLVEHQDTVLRKAALLLNAEHTAHALVDHWGAALQATNSLGPFDWSVNGSAALLAIADRSFDEFGIPRWAQMNGLRGEVGRIEDLVPSINLMHAGVLLHSNAETADAIPASGLAATARAYAKIIDEANRLELSALVPGATGPR